jgi:hypothetical protein
MAHGARRVLRPEEAHGALGGVGEVVGDEGVGPLLVEAELRDGALRRRQVQRLVAELLVGRVAVLPGAVELLLELVRRSSLGEEGVEAFGWEQGRRLVEADAAPEALSAAFAGLGFAPEEVTAAAARRGGEMDVRLRACPFKDAVLAEGGHLICALHRGLVGGALERIDDDPELVHFEPKDPITAGCRVHVRGLEPRT